MEDQYDRPLAFDEARIPPDPAVAGQNVVPGVKVLLCMGLPEGTGDLTQCLHLWPVCTASSVRRRWQIQSSISSPMAVTS